MKKTVNKNTESSLDPLEVPDASFLRRLGRKYLNEAIRDQQLAHAHGIPHRGWRFFPPYACHACGTIISARQFAFARSCGGCDVNGGTRRLSLGHKGWFLEGRAVDERTGDPMDIDPQFIPAREAHNYPAMPPLLKHPIPPPSPRPPYRPYRPLRNTRLIPKGRS